MQPNQRAKREGKRLFRICLVDGAIDGDRARRTAQTVAAGGGRNRLAVLAHFRRLLKLDLDSRTALVESAAPLTLESQADIAGVLGRRYGSGLTVTFSERPSLIGGIRIQVGCNVYDGSVSAALAALERTF